MFLRRIICCFVFSIITLTSCLGANDEIKYIKELNQTIKNLKNNKKSTLKALKYELKDRILIMMAPMYDHLDATQREELLDQIELKNIRSIDEIIFLHKILNRWNYATTQNIDQKDVNSTLSDFSWNVSQILRTLHDTYTSYASPEFTSTFLDNIELAMERMNPPHDYKVFQNNEDKAQVIQNLIPKMRHMEKFYNAEQAQEPYKDKINGLHVPQKDEITLNTMWINTHHNSFNSYIFPDPYRRAGKEINIFERLDEWAEDYKTILWYDAQTVTPTQLENTKTAIGTQCKFAHNIELRDVRTLKFVESHPTLFTNDVPIYARVDLLRVIAAYEMLKPIPSDQRAYFMYADLSIDGAIPYDGLIQDEEFIYNIEHYGIIMGIKGIKTSYENNFMILASHQGSLLAALKLGLIDINRVRIESSLKSQHPYDFSRGHTKSNDQFIYDSYPGMMKVFYALDDKATLTDDTGKSVFDDFAHTGLESDNQLRKWFGARPSDTYHLKFSVTDPELKNMEKFKGLKGVFIPTKEVLAPASGHG